MLKEETNFSRIVLVLLCLRSQTNLRASNMEVGDLLSKVCVCVCSWSRGRGTRVVGIYYYISIFSGLFFLNFGFLR